MGTILQEGFCFLFVAKFLQSFLAVPVIFAVDISHIIEDFFFLFDLDRLIQTDESESAHRINKSLINIVIKVPSTWNLESFLRQNRRCWLFLCTMSVLLSSKPMFVHLVLLAAPEQYSMYSPQINNM